MVITGSQSATNNRNDRVNMDGFSDDASDVSLP